MAAPFAELLEEIVALVIADDKGREIFHADLADSLHAQLFEIDHFDRLDVLGARIAAGPPMEPR